MTVSRCLAVKQMRGSTADIERALHQIARFQDASGVDRPDDHIDRVLLETLEPAELSDRNEFAIDEERVESLPLRPSRDIGVEPFARLDERREHSERSAFYRGFHLLDDRSEALFFHRQIAVRAKLRPGLGEEEAEEMIHFRDRGDG